MKGIKGDWQGRLSDDLEKLEKSKGYGYSIFNRLIFGRHVGGRLTASEPKTIPRITLLIFLLVNTG